MEKKRSFFSMFSFTLGIPSIFKITISTLSTIPEDINQQSILLAGFFFFSSCLLFYPRVQTRFPLDAMTV